MTRVAIYARYSSDLQSESSIEDQVELCRRYADQRGWKIVNTFEDRALSGASDVRPGFQAMKDAAERREFDVILSESLDRLSRRVTHVTGLHDELQFLGISLHTVATGEVNALLVGILSSLGQQFLVDLRNKTIRGLLGRIMKGMSAGGLAYGYGLVHDETGVRRIDDTEAGVVRRIFTDYANGLSPRRIARDLNEEGIRGPRGREWRDTAIRGQRERGTGILNNDLYRGELVWNRCSYVKNPRTGKRTARPNPADKWERYAVPELRIVDDKLWQRVKARQQQAFREMERDQDGNALNRAHRKRYMLSGLIKCRVCGAGYAVMAKDRYGCSGHRNKGTCDNSRTIKRQTLEQTILDALKDELLAPACVEAFVEEFQTEVDKLAKSRNADRHRDEKELADVQRKIDGLIRAIEDGMYNDSMKARMTELEERKAELEARLDEDPSATVSVLPNLAALYREKVAALSEALNEEAVKPKRSSSCRR